VRLVWERSEEGEGEVDHSSYITLMIPPYQFGISYVEQHYDAEHHVLIDDIMMIVEMVGNNHASLLLIYNPI
jgi:hypothetical protein